MVAVRSLVCTLAAVWFGALVCISCSGPTTQQGGPGIEPGTKHVGAQASNQVRLDNTPLWTLAPDDTRIGIVISSTALDSLVPIMTELERLMNARPGGRFLMESLARAVGDQPFDILDPNAWARVGIDGSAGIAIFGRRSSGDDTPMLMAFRLRDPNAFRRIAGTTRETVRGRSVDRNESVVCMPVHEWYMCASDMDMLLAAEGVGQGLAAEYAARIPERERGHIEMLFDLSDDEDYMNDARFQDGIRPTGKLAFSARLGTGSARFWFFVEARTETPMLTAIAQHDAMPTAAGVSTGAHDLVRVHLPFAAAAEIGGVPASVPLSNGADLRADLIENLTGELTGYSAGGGIFDYHIVAPLLRPDAGKQAVVGVCQQMAPLLTNLDYVRPLQMTASGCATVVELDTSWSGVEIFEDLAKEHSWVPVSLWVDDDGLLRLDLGGTKAPLNRGNNVGSGSAREITDGAWHMAMWGLYFDVYAVLPQALARLMDAEVARLNDQGRQLFDLYRWLAGHLYEVGAGVAVRPDGLHIVGQFTTFAADPEPAYRAYESALSRLLDGDVAGYRQDMSALSRQFSTTLAARYGRELMDEVSVIGQLDTLFAQLGVIEMLRDQGMAVAPAP